MDPAVLTEVKDLAEDYDTPYQTLLKKLVLSGLVIERAEREGSHKRIGVDTVPFPQGSARRSRVRRHTEAVRRRGHVLAYCS
jgi:hypothetical protein